jgi:hypothetical protein
MDTDQAPDRAADDLSDWTVTSFNLAVPGARTSWRATNRETGAVVTADSRRELLRKIAAAD